MSVIQARNVTKQYKVDDIIINALSDINLEIEAGEFVAIKGPSGSGKSTLLHLLGCVDRPSSGDIFINHKNTSNLSAGELVRLRLMQIGFVFQQFYLLPALTAFENVELPMREAWVPKKERKKRTLDLLDLMGLADRTRHMPSQLSGGEQQRVAIARALANNPAIIVADEPTGELDSTNGERILQIFESINQKSGQTILVVSHDEYVTSRAHRIIHLKDGRIVE
ncbi:MAG: ABC transporter ATP-binding protein [ANME-2 cluster archaeon]|nr:ABC transporter ATP-binding protein [ANME-2 cluster archaeon]MCL7475005.1 ABC transporter ATP-binding protein [ANME-2 cluster archaeon]MDF1530961.1 ABC transporter ATP-binding protein [ANME-2 cluster archaeon]MDW7775094.1 ABC transporter ATP-binding protein [Methanosarcinales archaeon]